MVGHPPQSPLCRGHLDEGRRRTDITRVFPFDEGLNNIFDMDTVFSQVSTTSMILAVFASINPGLSKSAARTLDATVLEISVSTLRQDALAGSPQRSVLGKPPRGSSFLARISGFVILPFLASSSRRVGVLLSQIAG